MKLFLTPFAVGSVRARATSAQKSTNNGDSDFREAISGTQPDTTVTLGGSQPVGHTGDTGISVRSNNRIFPIMASVLMSNAVLAFMVINIPAAAFGQNAVTVTVAAGEPIILAPKSLTAVFVPSNASNAEKTLSTVTLAQAQTTVLGGVVGTLSHVPVMGLPVAVAVAENLTKVFSHAQRDGVKGFNIAFLQGLSSSSAIGDGAATLAIPKEALQSPEASDLTPVLLRIKPSVKDSARIVRSTRVSMKQTDSSINPTASVKVLGIEQDAVACRSKTDSRGMTLTPMAPLKPGEYALVISSHATGSSVESILWAWDFRVVP
jgi:hypothetical protein